MGDELKVRFAPRNSAGAYNCAVEIVRMGRFCKVYLRPEKEGGYVNQDSLQELMDVAERGRGRSNQFWVGNVQVRKSVVPEYEIELLDNNRRYLSFEQAVAFFAGISSFKRV